MGKKEDSNLGDDIKMIVQDAVNSMDFHGLDQNIRNTVNSALNEIKKTTSQGLQAGVDGILKNTKPENNRNKEAIRQDRGKQTIHKNESSTVIRDSKGRYRKVAVSEVSEPRRPVEHKRPRKNNAPVIRPLVNSNPPGRVSNKFLTMFGVTGAIGFGLGTIAAAIEYIEWYDTEMVFAILSMFIFFAISLYMIYKGNAIRKRLRRYRQYIHVLHGRNYCDIHELANQIGKRDDFVVKDLRKMIELEMFPYGRFDDKNTCLILDNESYEQYLSAKKAQKERELYIQEQKRIEEQNVYEEDVEIEEQSVQDEVRIVMEQGEDYIRQIQEANDAIPGEDISRKLDTMKLILEKIFEHIKKHPEKLPELSRFMDYYLPTTLKLVNAYKEFDQLPVQGDNIGTGKKEIQNTLDTINKAFVNLFDNLFADTAMDISTDISVLRTILAQEGLTGSDFE